MDDEESFLEVASHFMQKTRGLEVQSATSVRSALDMMSQTSFDVIVSDYQMPETDGIDFLKTIRAGGSDLPFILFTGKGRESVVIEALNQGADFYLQKGGDLRSQFHELASMISQAVQGRRASDDLVDSRERFRGLADSISDLLIGLDDDFRVTFWNKAATDVLEIPSAEAIGMTAFDLLPRIKGTPVEEAFRTAASSRNMKSTVIDLLSVDGERTFEVRVYPGVEGLLVFARDVTATKAAAQLLTESEERYKALVEASPNAIVVYATDTIIYANPAAVRVYGGNDESDLIGKRIFDLMPPEFAAETAARIRKMHEESVPVPPRSVKVYTKTGGTIDMEINSIPITFSGRKAVQTILRDVTEEKRADALLRARQEELRTIIDSVPAMISYQDAEGRFLRVNRPFAEATGMDEEHLRGRKVEDVLPGFGEMFSPRDMKVVETGRPLSGALISYPGKHGVRWARTDKIPYVDDAGEVVGILTVAEDITERKKTEEALRESEEKFRFIVELSNERIWMMTLDGKMIYNNPAIETILGYSSEELLGSDTLQHMHDEDRRRIEEMLPGLIERREGWENLVVRWRRKDGSWAILESNSSPVINADGIFVGYIGSDRDITERVKTEELLIESEEAFRSLAENSPYAVMIGDGKGGLLYANRRLAELTGYSVDELLNLNAFEKLTRPEDRESMEERMKKRMEEVSPSELPYERILLRKDGTEVLTELTPTITMWKGENRPLALIQDITERKKAEEGLRMVNKKLNLLGGITRHDSLNQLTALKGWLTIAIEQEGDDSVRDLLVKAEKAADSLKMHLDFTAQYKSLGMKRPEWMPLAEVVAKVTEGLGRQGISVSVEVEDVEIFADPMLENVFRNLVNNSIAHGGHVDSISFSYEEGKDGLVMIYEDNGVGISTEEKTKIFARGFGKRHGYGLYLSWEILSITGMTLKETGIPTKGVRFEMSVPPGNYRRRSE